MCVDLSSRSLSSSRSLDILKGRLHCTGSSHSTGIINQSRRGLLILWNYHRSYRFFSLLPRNVHSSCRSHNLANISSQVSHRTMSTPQFVIDTDVGSDDTMAIVLCVAAEMRGDAKVLGITCVHGNTTLDNVCINTLKTLDTMGRLDIPVYRGAEKAVLETFVRAGNIHGSDGFGDFIYPNPPNINLMQKMHAVNYLTKLVAEKPGEVVLLCLGPLTNIALAIRMDPNFANNVKQIYIMGGNNAGVGNITAAAEFNFYSDPEAAYVVIHNMKCPITVFPWETACLHGKITYEWRKNVLGGLKTKQMLLMNNVEEFMLSRNLYGFWHRCDPMTVAVAIRPGIIKSSVPRYVSVELHGQLTRGALVVDHLNKLQKGPNVTIIELVDIKMYKEMLMEAFSMDMTKNKK